MDNSRYAIQWAGECKYDNHHKVWGWFFYIDPTMSVDKFTHRRNTVCYTFWGGVGKTANFKKHQYFSSYAMNRLVAKKTTVKVRKDVELVGYTQITIEELTKMWPNIYNDFNDKFIFNLLADSF